MFYSHEILTNRKYGVATVWLVATMGARDKSTVSIKKVTKKAINAVDIRKACETIMEPEAPMALRLQSNLMYGVYKVNNEQWRYLLGDAHAAQHNIRAMLRSARSDGLDPNAGKANPEQLIMMDDPGFSADMPLPDFGFDLDRALTPQGDTQRSSQSMLSIRGRSGSVSSHAASVIGLNISSSSNGGGAYQLPTHDLFRNSSAHKTNQEKAFEEEELVFEDDDLFDFDADGQLRDIPASERDARRAASMAPQFRLGSDPAAASGRVRKDHEDAQRAGHILPIYDAEGDYDMQYGDDDMGLPDAEAFPVMAGGLGRDDEAIHRSDEDHVHSSPGISSPISAEATQVRKRVKKTRFLKVDTSLVVNNMKTLQLNYLNNMAAETLANDNRKAVQQARPNAFQFVFGSGLNSTGQFGKLAAPLDIFSGEALMKKITGNSLTKTKRGGVKKRAHGDESDNEPSTSKRARVNELGRGIPTQDDDAFNMPDDDPYPMNDDPDVSIEIERGRDAQDALPDYPSSAMPWNVSASLHSRQRGHSSSVQGGGRLGSLGPAGRRLTSASPLIGRGSALPGDLGAFNDMMDLGGGDEDEMVMYGRSDDGRSSSLPGLGFGAMGIKSSSQVGINDEDFEIFGAAAGVDTQTAGESQWLKSVLDTESNNFLEYVRNTIEEKSVDELSQDGEVDGAVGFGDGGKEKSVTFEELFEPEKNTCMVAAQAFYHVLSLATKRRVWVEQAVEDLQPWGQIRIGVLGV